MLFSSSAPSVAKRVKPPRTPGEAQRQADYQTYLDLTRKGRDATPEEVMLRRQLRSQLFHTRKSPNTNPHSA